MPLLIDSRRLDVSLPAAQILQTCPELEERARNLKSQPTQIVGPHGFLYVQQRELAATTPHDRSISILGSEDATTCHIIVLRHTGSGATCLAHCDGSDSENEVAAIIQAVKSLTKTTEGRLELHMVGGFNDQRQLSLKLSRQLLKVFHQQAEDVHLVTLCVTDINDKKENGIHLPVIYGIAVNVKTGEIFKAKFQDRQPDEDLRSAYIMTGGHMVNVYDAETEQLNIGPYSWLPFPNIEFWLSQEDKQILDCFSTSPQAEPPYFVQHMKSSLQYLKNNPHPQVSVFPNKTPRSYKKKADGQWERIQN
ncbi:protein N-terminal asparagine amidohydrolase isoform X1 [Bufo gargarizans]|uniref:protein N-terminal asparagine amidohydrolase isoform X1 n=1 Tax=Bufo gargarizans TaxID=30331 RepID=UPI001CF3AAB3|nr:protein N-terminal asparagine amidohydrolase isoform X1 [Bufo gargarizans]